MTTVRLQHQGVTDLASDCRKVVRAAPTAFRKVVREAAIVGNTVARDNARRQHTMNSRYDIHYSRSFTWEMRTSLFGAASGFTAEYGPIKGRPQGGMSFEYGSRNQPPHLDLNKSADLIAPAFANEARDAAGDLFWPES